MDTGERADDPTGNYEIDDAWTQREDFLFLRRRGRLDSWDWLKTGSEPDRR